MADKRAATYHNMSAMLNAGLDVLRVFRTVTQGLKGSYKLLWQQLEESVTAGSSISDAMRERAGAFDEIDILMIDAAERSGNLPKAFELLSKWYEFRHRIFSKIKSGLILPVLVLNVAAFVCPIPDLVSGEITASGYFGKVWAMLMIFYVPAILILIILKLGKKKLILRYALDYIALWVPALGKGIFNLSLSRYCRSFYMLCSAGLGAIETAEIATELTSNFVVRGYVQGGCEAVRAGKNTSEGFNADRLPAEFVALWHVGEESGTMEKVTLKLADLTADRAEFWLGCFATWLPKIVYVCVGIMVVIKIFEGFNRIYGGLGAGY